MPPISKGQYYAIRSKPSVNERKLISYYELQWMMNHRIPTVAEVAEHLKLSQITVNYYLAKRDCVKKALDERGIPWQNHSQTQLTEAQIAAASLIMNFSDGRPISHKLDALGVNTTQYQAWLKDPQFKNLLDSLADQNKVNIRPHAVAEFTKKINAGDWNAIKYYMDATGEFVSTDSATNAQVIPMLIEVIMKHVKDPQVIGAIAQEFAQITGMRPQHEITADYVVTDVEVEEAAKVLGI